MLFKFNLKNKPKKCQDYDKWFKDFKKEIQEKLANAKKQLEYWTSEKPKNHILHFYFQREMVVEYRKEIDILEGILGKK